MAKLKLNPKRTALLIQDLQNDVIIEKGAFADSGCAAAREGSERGREREEARGRVPQGGRSGDPRLVHRREGRARA